MLDKLYYMLDSTYSSYAAPLSYVARTWALHCCILPSFAAPYWASMHPFFELRCTLWAPLYPVSSTAPCKLHCTLWAMLHNTELTCILLSYAETLLSYTHPTELPNTLIAKLHPTELCCTRLSYAVPYWATVYPPELPNNLWATLHPTELRCTPLGYGAPTIRNEKMNDNEKISLIWGVRLTIGNWKMNVYLMRRYKLSLIKKWEDKC